MLFSGDLWENLKTSGYGIVVRPDSINLLFLTYDLTVKSLTWLHFQATSGSLINKNKTNLLCVCCIFSISVIVVEVITFLLYVRNKNLKHNVSFDCTSISCQNSTYVLSTNRDKYIINFYNIQHNSNIYEVQYDFISNL